MENTGSRKSILLVDDDPVTTAVTGGDLEARGYDVTTADSGEAAIDILAESTFDLVITDLVMGSVGGLDVLKKAKEIRPQVMVILLTEYGDMDSVIEAIRTDADDYLVKPCDFEEMNLRIEKCFEKMRLRNRLHIYESILSVCPVCKKIRTESGMDSGSNRWVPMEKYICDRPGLNINSSYCPECARDFGEFDIDIGCDF